MTPIEIPFSLKRVKTPLRRYTILIPVQIYNPRGAQRVYTSNSYDRFVPQRRFYRTGFAPDMALEFWQMETVEELLGAVRARFPELSEKVDRKYLQRFEDEKFELVFLWFECLADVLNTEMTGQVPCETYMQFFDYVSRQVAEGSRKIYECVDVALVENMFFEVKAAYAEPYWETFPNSLKDLYLGFHGRQPF